MLRHRVGIAFLLLLLAIAFPGSALAQAATVERIRAEAPRAPRSWKRGSPESSSLAAKRCSW